MLQHRFRTAVAVGLVVLLSIVLGGPVLTILTLVVYGFVNYEYYSFAVKVPRKVQLFLFSLSSLLPLGYLIAGPAGFFAALVVDLVLTLVTIVLIIESAAEESDYNELLPAAVLGVGYPGVLGCCLPILTTLYEQTAPILWLVLIVVASDTFAYFVGRSLKTGKLAPRISPNKTIGGAVGGLAGAVGVGLLFAVQLGLPIGIPTIIAYSMMIGVLAQFGDLVESAVKRIYKIKDSGSILPGHGGVLDRVDALMFSAPFLLLTAL